MAQLVRNSEACCGDVVREICCLDGGYLRIALVLALIAGLVVVASAEESRGKMEFDRGVLFQGRGDLVGAVAAFNRALECGYRLHVSAARLLAIYSELGRDDNRYWGSAEALIAKLENEIVPDQDSQDAVIEYFLSVGDFRKRGAVRTRREDETLSRSYLDEALVYYQKAAGLSSSAKVLKRIGDAYFLGNDFHQASIVYDQLREMEPLEPGHAIGAARIYSELGAWELAAQAYEDAIARDPRKAVLYDLYADVLFKLGRIAEAEKNRQLYKTEISREYAGDGSAERYQELLRYLGASDFINRAKALSNNGQSNDAINLYSDLRGLAERLVADPYFGKAATRLTGTLHALISIERERERRQD